MGLNTQLSVAVWDGMHFGCSRSTEQMRQISAGFLSQMVHSTRPIFSWIFWDAVVLQAFKRFDRQFGFVKACKAFVCSLVKHLRLVWREKHISRHIQVIQVQSRSLEPLTCLNFSFSSFVWLHNCILPVLQALWLSHSMPTFLLLINVPQSYWQGCCKLQSGKQ